MYLFVIVLKFNNTIRAGVWLHYVNVKYHTIAGIILLFYCVIFTDMMIEVESYNL